MSDASAWNSPKQAQCFASNSNNCIFCLERKFNELSFVATVLSIARQAIEWSSGE